MDLIEKLGGYDVVKAAALNYRNSGDALTAKKFESACLEYRREHNIFEKKDRIVFSVGLNDFVFEVQTKPKKKSGVLHLTVLSERGTKFSLMEQFVRHATDEEIKAGHRL